MSTIAVTGIGAVTPIGVGRAEVWEGLLAGRCGIGPVESFETSNYRAHLGAEVKGFDAAAYLERLDPQEVGRATGFAIASARLALADAGLEAGAARSSDRLERWGVAMGTTSGEPLEVEHFNDLHQREALGEMGPRFMRRYPCQAIAGRVATELGCTGPVAMIPNACAAGSYAVAHAFDLLRSGRADIMLAGGSDAFSRITFTGFARLGAIAPERCQPFDRGRKGMVPGEGSAVLVLERLDDARARGARIYAEVAGYGVSCDAHHMTGSHPEGDGAVRAMRQALRKSAMRPEEISYVSAHGTGTPTNDRMESHAHLEVFGEAGRGVPMSSIKSMLGHTMGAASAIEAAVCALAVAENRVPPTIHFEEPDPECDVDCVANVAREMPVQAAMSNAYAFGGNNASLLLREVAS